ncbi:MAG TPA: hypothetical protein VFV19_03525 [Candidatus Polarisedimenticolaceae bacterium]|nr:hypothetical protein [Candidatus Polarisedimenticolaceae bacterium]
MPTPLSRALLAGAAFDALFAVAILAVPGLSASLLGIELPPDPIYLDLVGVLLLILAGIYAAASRAPGRYPAVAPVSAAGRLFGCALLTRAWATGHPRAFLILGIADLVLAVATAAAWWREHRLSA